LSNRVRDILTGKEQLPLGRGDRNILDPLLGRWYAGDEWRTILSDGFSELYFDPDVRLRSAAVLFFASYTADPGDLAVRALRDRLDLFDGVEEPWRGGGVDLRALVASTVSRQILERPDALALSRHEALRPGYGQAVIALLLPADPLWVRDHAVELVKSSPGVLIPLLFHLKLRAIDLQPLLRALSEEVSQELLLAATREEAPELVPWLREHLGLPPAPAAHASAAIAPPALVTLLEEDEAPLVIVGTFDTESIVPYSSWLSEVLARPVRVTLLAGLRGAALSPSRARELGAMAAEEGKLWLLGTEGAPPDVVLAAGAAISEHRLAAVIPPHPDGRGLLTRASLHLVEAAEPEAPPSPVAEHRRLIGQLLDHDASEVFDKLEQLLDTAPQLGEALLLEMAARKMDLRGAIALLRDRVDRDTLKGWVLGAVPDELERLVYLAMI
jgi:hypothetical protein